MQTGVALTGTALMPRGISAQTASAAAPGTGFSFGVKDLVYRQQDGK